MRRLLAGLLGALLLAACGTGRTQVDQDRDGRLLAGALRAAWTDGTGFKLDQQLLITGGDIPSGQALQLHGVVDAGTLRDGTAQFPYRIEQARQQSVTYAMVIAGERLYVKREGGSAWKTAPVASVTTLFPALRLDLVREAVLLARSVSTGSLSHLETGFARKYVVRPAPDQLEQLESIAVRGAAEQQFLKTASGEVDVYLTFPGDRLTRLEVHMSGTDPSNQEVQSIVCTLDLHSARLPAVQAPADAQQVDPGNILT